MPEFKVANQKEITELEETMRNLLEGIRQNNHFYQTAFERLCHKDVVHCKGKFVKSIPIKYETHNESFIVHLHITQFDIYRKFHKRTCMNWNALNPSDNENSLKYCYRTYPEVYSYSMCIGDILRINYHLNKENPKLNKIFQKYAKRSTIIDTSIPDASNLFAKLYWYETLFQDNRNISFETFCKKQVIFDRKHCMADIEFMTGNKYVNKLMRWFISGIFEDDKLEINKIEFTKPKSLKECVELDLQLNHDEKKGKNKEKLTHFLNYLRNPLSFSKDEQLEHYPPVIVSKNIDYFAETYPYYAFHNFYFTTWHDFYSYAILEVFEEKLRDLKKGGIKYFIEKNSKLPTGYKAIKLKTKGNTYEYDRWKQGYTRPYSRKFIKYKDFDQIIRENIDVVNYDADVDLPNDLNDTIKYKT